MVIQRRRTSAGYGGGVSRVVPGPTIAPLVNVNQISSSEDEDSVSNGTLSWDKQRCPDDMLKSINERLTSSHGSEKGVTGSLELLRLNVQKSFDQEVAVIVTSYKDKFFSKAFANLKNNLGDHAVTENDLLKIFQKMVQQSAVQFNCPIQQPAQITLCPSTTTTTDHPGPLFDMSDSEEEDSLGAIPTSLPMFNSTFQKFSPFPVWKSSSCASEEEHKRARKRAAAAIAMTTTGQGDGQAVKKPTTTFDILHSTLTRPSNYSRSSSTWNSKVKWNTSAVNKDTLFVLDSQANKLFHVTEDVTAKHPELIRYSTDNQEDLNWLANERIIPGAWQRLHSSVQLLVRDEVVKLKMKEQPGWDAGGGLVGFKVPEFMIRRMHKYFTELSIKNERIKTNSGYFDTISTSGTKKEDVFSRSNLSTSHATLSALLANCSEVQEN